MPKARASHLSLPDRTAYRRLEDVVGCKWSAAVLAAIGRGVTRPGQLERFIPGISAKVLNERLRKLLDYRLVTRRELPGKILRVDYGLTPTGEKLSALIEQIRDLDESHAQRPGPARAPSRVSRANRTSRNTAANPSPPAIPIHTPVAAHGPAMPSP